MEESKRLQTGSGSAEFEVGEKQCREFVSCLINCVNWLDFSIYFWWEQHRRTWTEDALLLG